MDHHLIAVTAIPACNDSNRRGRRELPQRNGSFIMKPVPNANHDTERLRGVLTTPESWWRGRIKIDGLTHERHATASAVHASSVFR